jgi:hypothetical protein
VPPNQRICDPFTRNRTMRQGSPGVRRMGGQGSQVKCLNLVQLCVQVGAVSKLLANSYPPSGGERVLPYGGRMAIKRRRARDDRG